MDDVSTPLNQRRPGLIQEARRQMRERNMASTTEIYPHALNKGGRGVVSPID